MKVYDKIEKPFFFLLFVIVFDYGQFVIEFLILLRPKNFVTFMVIYHILFVMVIWSLISTIVTDPGYFPRR